MEKNIIRIGTRGSALALAQAGWVRRKLEEAYPGLKVQTIKIKTSGDRFLTSPIKAIEGKGIFVKEIEDALLQEKIDLAVHSMKDLPTEIPAGLTITAITEREDPRDALVSAGQRLLKDLPAGSKVGTGSLRRQTQILHHRPDLVVVPIRGNVETRLKKLDRGEVDGLVMAVAGLKRIGHQDRISEYLSLDVCLNAVAQGALGLETRDGDPVNQMVAFLHHHPSATEVLAERAFLGRLGGGCQIPVGARGYVEGDRIKLMGVVGDASGKRLVRGEVEGKAEDAKSLGEELAERLLSQGADQLLNGGEVDSKGKAKGNPKPLLGRCIMITRPRIQSGSFVRGLEELGSEVIECPTIEIIPPESYVPLDRTIQALEEYDWIVFTSVNGVKEFLNRLQYLGKDSAALEGIRLAAIGPETAREIASHGIQVEFVPADYRAEGILHGLNPAEVEGKRFLLPRAATARDILPRTLKQWGAEVDVVQAYRTVPAKGSAAILSGVLSENKVDMVTFTSSSTVKYFVDLLSPVDLRKFCNAVAVACIGPITKGTAESNKVRVDVLAKEYTVSGLIEAIVEYFSNGPGRVY